MPERDRHVVVNWTHQFGDLKKTRPAKAVGHTYETTANGPVWALLSLGYDLFCLQAKNRVPEFIVERLSKKLRFQGARYELAAAAIIMRSGFDVRFLDKTETSVKHCEFIATHRTKEIQVGVEAKSRKRPGSIHEPGSFSLSKDARGLENLIRQAKEQRPSDLPFLIFVDLNMPTSSGLRIEDRPWFRDFTIALDRINVASAESPDPYSALILTNFSFHYGPVDEAVPRPESALIIPKYPCQPLDSHLLEVLRGTLDRYGFIPDEI